MRFPVLIALHRSVRMSLLVVVSHFIALGATLVLPLAWQSRSFLAVLVILSAQRAFRTPAIAGLRILASDKLETVSRDGAHAAFEVCEQSVVYREVIALRGRSERDSKAINLVLFSDQMSKRQFHQLRLWLRCQTPSTKGVGSLVS